MHEMFTGVVVFPSKEDENILLDNTKWPGKKRLVKIIMTVRDTLAV